LEGHPWAHTRQTENKGTRCFQCRLTNQNSFTVTPAALAIVRDMGCRHCKQDDR